MTAAAVRLKLTNWDDEAGSTSSKGWEEESIQSLLLKGVLLLKDEMESGLEKAARLTAAQAKKEFEEGGERAKQRTVKGAFVSWKAAWLRAVHSLYRKTGSVNLGKTRPHNTGVLLRLTGGRKIGSVRVGRRPRRVILAAVRNRRAKQRVRLFRPRQKLAMKRYQADMAGNKVFSIMEKSVYRLIMSFTDTDVNGPDEHSLHELPGSARNWPDDIDWSRHGYVVYTGQMIAKGSLDAATNA